MADVTKLKSYIVIRDHEDDTTHVQDYGTDHDEAYAQIGVYEFHGYDCVLLGAWSVDDLKTTHGSWFLNNVIVREMLPNG